MTDDTDQRERNYRALKRQELLIREPWREYTSLGHPWEMPPKNGSPSALRKLLFIYGSPEPINLDEQE